MVGYALRANPPYAGSTRFSLALQGFGQSGAQPRLHLRLDLFPLPPHEEPRLFSFKANALETHDQPRFAD